MRRVNCEGADDRPSATEQTAAGESPGQEDPRQQDDGKPQFATRSHKSASRRLTDSPHRMDSRAEIYAALAAWPGQRHE